MLHGGGGMLNEAEVVRKAGKDRINEFLRSHACYDVLKQSAKVSERALHACKSLSLCAVRLLNW
jgi:hypothetical protein